MDNRLKCSILTPEKIYFEGEVNFVVVQAHDGEMGFLYNHSALISELGIGEVRLRSKTSTEYLVIEGGIVEVKDNKLIVLAEKAAAKSDLNKDELERKMKELKESRAGKSIEELNFISVEEKKVQARLTIIAK